MNKNIFVLFVFLSFTVTANAQGTALSLKQISDIGNKVFANECSSKDENLIKWNEGEDFISCGIGHFIWYSKNYKGPFVESFPKFLNYAKSSGVKIPKWVYVSSALPCPWDSRDDFLSSQNDIRIKELRDFLIDTKLVQAKFIVKGLEDSLLLILKNSSEHDSKIIRRQFERVISTSSGAYALADYINFKGLGVVSSEQYQGKGWGLFHVLLNMRDENESPNAIEEFAASANKILTERVSNSPVERNEKRWLPGWQNRVNSYLK
ncbi:hypothetical protein KKC59_02855 [bacterium]|nr:hypothetical protein [bacterium]